MKDRNFTHGPTSGAAIAIPAIIILAIAAAIVLMNSSCGTPKAERLNVAPSPRPLSTPRHSQSPVMQAGRPMTDGKGDPLERPEWFEEELRRIEAGLDESQKTPEERGKNKR